MTGLYAKNYFELFDLPKSFDIDTTALRDRYRELQKTAHPDKHAAASDQQRRISVQFAAQINEAFQTLREPIARARYLLSLHGVVWRDENKSLNDPDFLMEQMALRERLEELYQGAQTSDDLIGILDEIESKMASMVAHLSRCFESGSEADFREAQIIVQKLQFFSRVREEAEEATL